MSLVVRDLEVWVASRRLVGPVSFSLTPGEATTIIGETGAGKSLLAQAIMGSLPRALTARGSVELDGLRLDSLPRRDREALWGRRISLLPQEPWRALDPLMQSGMQVAESHALVAGRDWTSATSRSTDDLVRLGLAPRTAGQLPGTLSGGMAQRVAFAAVTASGPQVLMADEPTKGLDEHRRGEVTALLKGFLASAGMLLTITHDIAVARALGGSVMILRAGAVVEQGAAGHVLDAPQSAYGRELVAADPANWQRDEGGPRSGERVLEAKQLAIARGKRTLASGIEVSLAAGERLAVTGPSGLGKTTLLDTLAGLIPPAAGRVDRLGPALRPYALQKLYQDPPAAFPPRVALADTFRDLERRHRLPSERFQDLMARLGLAPDLLARRPDAVSGGELQRLALARVLALQPAVVLADEPTSRLDPVTQRHVMEVIAEVAAEHRSAVVLVTHSPTMARNWAGAVLDLGAHG